MKFLRSRFHIAQSQPARTAMAAGGGVADGIVLEARAHLGERVALSFALADHHFGERPQAFVGGQHRDLLVALKLSSVIW